MHSLVIFTTIKQQSRNLFGDLDYLSLSTAWIGMKQYTVFRTSIQATAHKRLKKKLPQFQARIPALRLKNSTRRRARTARSAERLLLQFSWVPRSPRQLQKIILLLLKTRPSAKKSQWRFLNTPFHIFAERTEASTSVVSQTPKRKTMRKTH